MGLLSITYEYRNSKIKSLFNGKIFFMICSKFFLPHFAFNGKYRFKICHLTYRHNSNINKKKDGMFS